MRAILVVLLLVGFAGCLGDKDADEPTEIGPDGKPVKAGSSGQNGASLDEPSEAQYTVMGMQERWIPMSDGKRIHNAMYLPKTNESVPVFINFSPYWGDTAELGGDAFSQYMIDYFVPRGYAVVLSAIRGTGHSEGCFQIAGDRELQDINEVVDYFSKQSWSNGNIATGGKSYDSTPTNGMIAKYPHEALKGVFHVSGITDMYGYNYKGGVPYATGGVFNSYYYLQGTDEYGASLVGAGGAQDEDPESLARLIDDIACTELPLMQASGVGSAVTGLKDDYWVERDWTRTIGDSKWDGSVFFVHGMQDWNVKPDHILPWLDLVPEQIKVKAWLHQWTQGGTGHVYPMRTDWNQTMLAWMDSELKGHNNGFWDEPRVETQAANNDWYFHEQWPPAPTKVTLSTADTTLLAPAEATHVSGSVRVIMNVTADGPDPIFTATMNLDTGGANVWVSEGVLRIMYRDGLDNPQPVVPGTTYQVAVDFYPVDLVVEPGSRLYLNFGANLRYPLTPNQSNFLTYESQAVVEVPISPGYLLNDQPTPMSCFAC